MTALAAFPIGRVGVGISFSSVRLHKGMRIYLNLMLVDFQSMFDAPLHVHVNQCAADDDTAAVTGAPIEPVPAEIDRIDPPYERDVIPCYPDR